jgi:hypothetical protein
MSNIALIMLIFLIVTIVAISFLWITLLIRKDNSSIQAGLGLQISCYLLVPTIFCIYMGDVSSTLKWIIVICVISTSLFVLIPGVILLLTSNINKLLITLMMLTSLGFSFIFSLQTKEELEKRNRTLSSFNIGR